MEQAWQTLLDLVILLSAAMVLGVLAEQLRQSALVGYIAAGVIVGPNVLGWVRSGQEVAVIAEIGVALLLFTIGLEFSFRELRHLGGRTLLAGLGQLLLTATIGLGAAYVFGVRGKGAAALGIIASLSSTACVVRVLKERAQLDSGFGRTSLGILLLQDAAVVPAVILMAFLGQRQGVESAPYAFVKSLGLMAGMVGLLYLVLYVLVPRVQRLRSLARNRELPILLATVLGIGSAAASHAVGISPSFGAFLTGLLLAESPLAGQIRADITALRTLMITLFFAAIGMVGNPVWTVGHLHIVLLVVMVILAGKSLIIMGIMGGLRFKWRHSLAVGLTLSQIGEFSFVLAGMAFASGLIDQGVFRLLIAVTIITLILTPYLTGAASAIYYRSRSRGRVLERGLEEEGEGPVGKDAVAEDAAPVRDGIVIVGFGPAGQRVAESLLKSSAGNITVVDMNIKNLELARGYGLHCQLGDASSTALLEHLPLQKARMAVITIPDHITARKIIQVCKAMSPGTAVFVRSRHHIYNGYLYLAGADKVVDEEDETGKALARECVAVLGDVERGA